MFVPDEGVRNLPPEQVPELLIRVAFYAPMAIHDEERGNIWVPGRTPDKRTLTWPALVSGLTRFRNVIDKSHAMGWSPGVPKGSRRLNADVEELSCIVLDIDNGPDFRAVSARFFGFALVAHSTWSHSQDRPRGRIVLPLAHPIPVQWWPRAFFWAQTQSGCAGDDGCKDPSRTYYLPATDGKRELIAWAEDGKFLDLRPFDRLPPTPQEVATEAARRVMPRAPREHWRPGLPDDGRKKRYAEAVLDHRCAELATVKANRHTALCAAAVLVGGYVGGGYLDEENAISRLVAAAISTGLPLSEARKTASDLVKAGARRPLHPPTR